MAESLTIDCKLGEDNTATIRIGSQSNVIVAKVLNVTYAGDGAIKRVLLDRLVINVSRHAHYEFKEWCPKGCYVTELEKI